MHVRRRIGRIKVLFSMHSRQRLKIVGNICAWGNVEISMDFAHFYNWVIEICKFVYTGRPLQQGHVILNRTLSQTSHFITYATISAISCTVIVLCNLWHRRATCRCITKCSLLAQVYVIAFSDEQRMQRV